MTSREIRICVQNADAFERVEEKNRFIQSSDTEWIGFVDETVAGKDEVCQILEENPFLMVYDVILFGDDVPEGECNHLQMLGHPQCTIFAFFFRKSLLVHTGSFNRFLDGNVNYEFLLRLAEKGNTYAIPCSGDKAREFNPLTMTYIVRHYMETMKEKGILDEVFLRFVQTAEQAGKMTEFKSSMNTFLVDNGKYEKIVADTAPCLIMVSDDVACYGVVDGFANTLADELVRLGQAVITTNNRYGEYREIPNEVLLNQVYKAIIGFQAPALQSKTFQNMKGERYQFWLDDPMFSVNFFEKTPKGMHILCQDANYAEFLRRHFGLDNAMQFPPAGTESGAEYGERIYDMVFIGSYISLPKGDYKEFFQREFYQYMLGNMDATVEQGIRSIWKQQEISYDETRFMQTLVSLRDVCYDILQVYRHRVVEAVLTAGLQLHVFGESWKKYKGGGSENLIIHPQLTVEESLSVWSQAKIGLNIMNGHKAGMTERIANIMLCGACCVSDETSYLKEHFKDGRNIVLFRCDCIEEMIEKIKYLLQHDEERMQIALAGRAQVLREHTWRKRTAELLEIIEKI